MKKTAEQVVGDSSTVVVFSRHRYSNMEKETSLSLSLSLCRYFAWLVSEESAAAAAVVVVAAASAAAAAVVVFLL